MSPRKGPATLLLAALAATGCATVPATEPGPVVEPPATWTATGSGAPPSDPSPEAAGAATQLAAETASWWAAFGDARLDRLVEQALAGNHDLAAAAARVDEAAALARIAGADLGPQAAVGFDGSRARRNFIGLPIPNGGDVLSTTSTSLGVSLNLSWEADLWGRLRARQGGAVARLEAAAADEAAARLSVAGQTAKAWFALVEASQQVALARTTLDSRQRSARQVRRRFESGLRPGLELRLALVNESTAEAQLAGRERQLDLARRQLELLLSRYPAGEIVPEADSVELPRPPAPLPAGLPSELVERRPDLVAHELRWASAGLAVKEARAALYPTLRLTGSSGRVSQEIGDLLDSEFSVWSLAAGLLQPLFQSGRLRAGVELSDARRREIAESYAQAVLRAFGEVELALSGERWLAGERQALERAAEQSVAAERLAQERYSRGIGSYLAVLEGQREASAAQSRLLEIRRQQLDARIDLHLALGGGWRNADENGGADADPANPPISEG
jgi:NodT family efflux transporter outer membrane factor (OMF) lipoprotein